uniref:Uncharacterized protein n=1 Tax=Anguilla anguilla TaxID=7936 RepID=A0A0E9QVW6_ANGAN
MVMAVSSSITYKYLLEIPVKTTWDSISLKLCF